MIAWILLFQGALFSSAWGCGLEDVCRASGIQSETVDPFSSGTPISARCSGPDASTSSWYIRRYMNGSDSLDGLGAPLTLNDSFRQNGNELTIHEVNGFAEGTYHCGLDNNTIQPASLCLFVRGQPVFISCPDEYEECSSIEDIASTANDSVSIDTRVTFNNGGFCGMTKVIRLLRVFKNQTQVYLCSNLGTFSNQLCENNEKFRVEQEQTCIEPDINLCKFNMILVLLNFSESDGGIYNVIIEFENAPIGRGTLSRQFNITLLNGQPNNNNSLTTSSTSFTTLPTLSDAARIGIGIGVGVPCILSIIAAAVAAYHCYKRNKKDETDGREEDYKSFLSAAETGNLDIVSKQIEKGIYINVLNEERKTALLIASKEGNIEIVKLLLKKGASIDHQDEEGWSSLILASYMGHTEVVQVLLENKAQVNLTNHLKWSALTNACHWNHIEVAKLLLKKGAKIDHRNDLGMTPLMVASSRGCINIVQLLLENGAEVDIRNHKGKSALSLAESEHHTEVVHLLRQKGHLLIQKEKEVEFLHAAETGDIDTVKKQIGQGINVNLVNEEGKTALMLASKEEHLDIAQLLLQNHAFVDQQDKKKWTSLMWACYGKNVNIIIVLLENNARVDLCNSMGFSALSIVCEWCSIDAAKLLLEKGAPVNFLNNKGMSPLMDASSRGHTEVIKLLLAYNAEVNLQNSKGQSALSFAKNEEILSLLKE